MKLEGYVLELNALSTHSTVKQRCWSDADFHMLCNSSIIWNHTGMILHCISLILVWNF